MTRLSLYLALCMLFIFLFDGCTPCFYTPNAQQVPLFRDSKEFSGSFSLQGGYYSTGMNMQAAFSPGKHIGIMANYHHFGASYDESSFLFSSEVSGHFRGNFGELGLGYFMTFQKNFVFEAYGGMGRGCIANRKTSYYYYNYYQYWNVDVPYNRYFIQPALGWSPNYHFELALSTRIAMIDYRNLKVKEGEDITVLKLVPLNNNPVIAIEPALTIRAGGKRVKFQYQASFSQFIGNSIANIDPVAMSFAVFVRIRGKEE